VVYETLKARWELWYQYIVRFHAGGDNIHRNQLFLCTIFTDDLHLSQFPLWRLISGINAFAFFSQPQDIVVLQFL